MRFIEQGASTNKLLHYEQKVLIILWRKYTFFVINLLFNFYFQKKKLNLKIKIMKFFCIIFIIFYIPSCISPNPLNYILPRKNSLQFECILEFILGIHIVKTELFAKNISENYKIFRRIVPNDEIKNLKIYKNDLNKYYFEKLENEGEANKKTEECFLMNEKILGKDRKYLSMKKLLQLSENKIFLPNEWQEKFDSLQNYMLDLIINSKLYKFGSIKPIFLDKLNGKKSDEIRKNVLVKAYRLKEKPNIVLQWKWDVNMPKPEETIFEEGDHGFQILKKCEELELDIGKNKILAYGKKKIDALKLLKYFNEEQLFFGPQFIKIKEHSSEMECVLEYILETRIVKTELFVKYISENYYKIFRRIVPNDEIKNLKIYKNDMNKYYFEKLENEGEANKKTEECFWINVEALDIDGNYLSMEKLISLKENQNVLSNEWHKKLDSLQNCMLDFIVNSKLYKFGSTKQIFLNELKGKTVEEKAILREYKNNENPNIVLRWNWGVKMPKPEETIYEEGHHGFQALKKCQQFELNNQKNNGNRKDKMLAQEKEKIDAMELLKYFNKEQLFMSHHIRKKHIPEIECILDYILETRIVQTEIFVEDLHNEREFQFFKRIVPNDEIKKLKIHKNDMNKYYFEKLANNFEAIEKTEECFSMNVQALEEDRNYLSMEKLFHLTENRLILPPEWQNKLDSLQNCMLDYIINSTLYKFGSIKPIFLDKLKGNTIDEIRKMVMIDTYRLKEKPNIVLQWKWDVNMPKPEETIFEEGDHGFQILKKCEELELDIGKNKILAYGKKKNDALKLLKYFNEEQLFFGPQFIKIKENSPEIECVLEYILETRIVKTEIFAKYISEHYKILRRILPNDEIKNLKIYKNDMNKYYFEKLKENEVEANKKTEECFWMNVEALDIDGNYLSMENLFTQKNNQNVFSKEWHKKLDSLQNCMLDFIINSKLYKFGNIIPIFLDEFNDKMSEKLAILREYKNNSNPNNVLRWNWGVKMPKPEETIYEEGHHGFQALKKCQQFELNKQKNNGNRKGKMLAQEKEKIDAMELLKYFNEKQLFFSSHHHFTWKHIPEIECILYYILETRIVQIEIFVEDLHNGREFQFFKRIVPNEEIKNLKIHKNDMNKYYFEKLANNFEAIEKTDECFSMNVEALEEDRNYLSMEKLFHLTENRLILPPEWQDKLDNLQECLLNFLVNSKFFTFGNIGLIENVIKKTPEEQTILIPYEFSNDKKDPKLLFQWKWGKNGEPKEAIYEEGDDGFEALKKCEQMGLVHKENGDATISEFESSSSTKNLKANHQQHTAELNGKMVAKGKEKIDLMKLLKYFKQEELFLRQFPNVAIFGKNIINMDEKHCAICLGDFENEDKLERLYCGHYFHWDCMQHNRKHKHFKCPICRENLINLSNP